MAMRFMEEGVYKPRATNQRSLSLAFFNVLDSQIPMVDVYFYITKLD